MSPRDRGHALSGVGAALFVGVALLVMGAPGVVVVSLLLIGAPLAAWLMVRLNPPEPVDTGLDLAAIDRVMSCGETCPCRWSDASFRLKWIGYTGCREPAPDVAS